MGRAEVTRPGTVRPPSRIRRWWLIGLVLIAVVAAAVTTMSIVVGRKVEGHPRAALLPGMPEQLLLASSIRQQPVPGWKLTVSQLGLPPGTVVKPLRNVGDRGYFLGIDGRGWWLVGVDVAVGRRLFAPVRLGLSKNAVTVDCFVNGPDMILCMQEERDPNTQVHTLVIDTTNGALIFDGPTDLRMRPDENHPLLTQVGDYVVATVTGEGIHGVGPHAELTWFVPGNGSLSSQFGTWDRDVAPQSLAIQRGTGSGDTVFSVADGKVIKPSFPKDQKLGSAIVYPNGFAYEYAIDYKSDRVTFFDNSGKQLSGPDSAGTLLIGSLDVPMVETEEKDVVITLDGRRLLEIPKSVLMPYARRIGTKLFITTDEKQRSWRQYDLRTGASGKTCDTEGLGFDYIASDGEVAIGTGSRTPAQAIDLATCDTLWSIPGETLTEVWKVNTTLVQRTNDELFSLVAPD